MEEREGRGGREEGMGEERGEEIGKDIKQFTCCSYCTRKRSCDLLLFIETLLIRPLFIEDQLKENNIVETANGNPYMFKVPEGTQNPRFCLPTLGI